MMTKTNEKASELDSERRESIESMLVDQRDHSFGKFIETHAKSTQYNFLVNGGSAIATLAFMGSEKGTYLAMWPLMCFVIGLVATGVQIRALLIFFGILHRDALKRSQGFVNDELTLQEIKPPQDLGKWAGRIENWSSWIAQGAFVVGVLLGAFIVMVSMNII
jgi:hypothetical protein